MGRRVGSGAHQRAQARTPGHTRARPPARRRGAAAESDFTRGWPAAPGRRQSPRGRLGRTARRLAPRAASSPRRRRPSRARGRRCPGPSLRSLAGAHRGRRRRRKGSGRRRRKWCGSVSGSGSADGRTGCGRRELIRPLGSGGAGPRRSWSRSAHPGSGPPRPLAAQSPRGHRALTLRVGATRTPGEAQLPAGRTLRTLRMNDDSTAHKERAGVTPASADASPPWALRAEQGRGDWLWGYLLGTM